MANGSWRYWSQTKRQEKLTERGLGGKQVKLISKSKTKPFKTLALSIKESVGKLKDTIKFIDITYDTWYQLHKDDRLTEESARKIIEAHQRTRNQRGINI